MFSINALDFPFLTKEKISVIEIDVDTVQQLPLPRYGDAYVSNGHALHQGRQHSMVFGHSVCPHSGGGVRDLELLWLVRFPLVKARSARKP